MSISNTEPTLLRSVHVLADSDCISNQTKVYVAVFFFFACNQLFKGLPTLLYQMYISLRNKSGPIEMYI